MTDITWASLNSPVPMALLDQHMVQNDALAGALAAETTALQTTGLINFGALSGFRNYLINGDFSINQKAVSGTVTLAAGVYGHDQWKAGAAGCTYTFSTVSNVTTITITSGSLLQIIEGGFIQSGTAVLTWVGSSQAKIGSGSFSGSGVTGTIVGGTNLTIEVNTGTVANIQLELGSFPTVFEKRLSFELALCQRYFKPLRLESLGFALVPGDGYAANIRLSPEMRAAPTLVAGATFTVSAGSAGTASLSISTTQTAQFQNSANNWTVNTDIFITGFLTAQL